MAQVIEPVERIGAAHGNHPAEVLRQGKGDRAGHAAAAGEAGQVGPLRIDAVVAPYLVEHVQHDTHALTRRAVVAGRVGRAEERPALLADFLPVAPAHRGIARRDEDDQRPGPRRIVGPRYVELVSLFQRVEVVAELERLLAEARGDELPVEARWPLDP